MKVLMLPAASYMFQKGALPMHETAAPAPGGKKLPLGIKITILVVAILAVLFAAYAAFCAWVGGDTLPPNTYVSIPGVAEPVAVGDVNVELAAGALTMAAQVDESRNITVTCNGHSAEIPADVFTVDAHGLLQEIMGASNDHFLARGIRFLSQRGRAETHYQLAYTYRDGDEERVTRLLENLALQVDQAPVETTWTEGEDSLEVTLGTPGQALDVTAAKEAILDAFQSAQTSLTLTTREVSPQALTAQALNDQIYVAPVPLSVDENGDTVAPVVGKSIDVETAQAALDAAAPGETVSIPLVRTQPDYTEASENGLLYQDLLSESVTNIGGSSGRLANVTLAAEKVNGVVLLPGDTFDYNKVVGKRTEEAGFHSAPAYVAGETVNEIGGGICQVSSALYYCTVYANLEVVTRSNHRYAVGYVPDGLDATVSWGGPEYRFRNDSDYPVKIVAFVEGRTLTVQFYGTNPEGIYVTTERTRVSTTNYTTVYQPDASIPQGTTKEKVTPYTGRKVIVYRCVYAADGTLLSRTQENTSDYKSRDRVILYNPADAASLGLDPEPSASVPASGTQTTPPAAEETGSSASPSAPAETSPSSSTEPDPAPTASDSAAPTSSPEPADIPPAETPVPLD